MKIQRIQAPIAGRAVNHGDQSALPHELVEADLPPSFSNGLSNFKTHSAPSASSGMRTQARPLELIRGITSTQTITNVVSQILGANYKRRYLLIQNTGLIRAFIGFSVTPLISGANGIELNPGFELELDTRCPYNDVSAILSAAGTGTLAILEGTSAGWQ